VEIGIDVGRGGAGAVVLGADLTHEYVSENADYRS
jgi:glutamate N-acetyltransferase/amino-acid N-acetyltransferase